LKQYEEKYANPIYEASNNWYLEDLIEPAETRRVLIRGLKMLQTKKKCNSYPKKHGNIPL
jgi:propionyl-CoA carboxylase beta chain